MSKSEKLAEVLEKITSFSKVEVLEIFEKPKDIKLGDICFPCFRLSKEKGLNPHECALGLANDLPAKIDGMREHRVVGPYVNFFFDRSQVSKEVVECWNSEVARGPKEEARSKETILVEYSSPNIAKTFHVGHLRTTLIGHSLAKIYESAGYNTISINHLGDWGTQFGFVYAGCKLWGIPEEASVDKLVDLYQMATSLRKAQDANDVATEDKEKPNVNEMARDYFLRLEAGDEEAVEFWQWCLDISLVYLKRMYERLGIHFDYYTGESFFRDRLQAVEEMLKNSGQLEESRGALGMDLGKELGFCRIFAEDGRSLYITRDIAAAIYRDETFDPEKILYVVAAQQTLHFKQLVAVLRKIKHPVADKIVHVPFGFVPGMSTRSGGAISLENFLNEARDRAKEAYLSGVGRKPEEVDPDYVAEAVSVGSTFFYFLSNSNIRDFQFSWKEALNFQGDSGPYLQYAFARLSGIFDAASKEGIEAAKDVDGKLLEKEAYGIIVLLRDFDEVIESALSKYEPHFIAEHLLSLAKEVARSYKVLRVVGAEDLSKAQTRLALFVGVKKAFAKGFSLLGIPPLERM